MRGVWRREQRADPRKIHALEYELGFRDDPPPRVPTDEPGTIAWFKPPPPSMRYASARERKALYQSMRVERSYKAPPITDADRKMMRQLIRAKKRRADLNF